MFAIIKTGGKQYRAEEGRELLIEKLEGDPGAVVTFSEVLLTGPDPLKLGRPFLPEVTVRGEILSQERGEKVVSIRYKAKKDVHKRRGHRQHLTRVRITGISTKAPAMKASKEAQPA